MNSNHLDCVNDLSISIVRIGRLNAQECWKVNIYPYLKPWHCIMITVRQKRKTQRRICFWTNAHIAWYVLPCDQVIKHLLIVVCISSNCWCRYLLKEWTLRRIDSKCNPEERNIQSTIVKGSKEYLLFSSWNLSNRTLTMNEQRDIKSFTSTNIKIIILLAHHVSLLNNDVWNGSALNFIQVIIKDLLFHMMWAVDYIHRNMTIWYLYEVVLNVHRHCDVA